MEADIENEMVGIIPASAVRSAEQLREQGKSAFIIAMAVGLTSVSDVSGWVALAQKLGDYDTPVCGVAPVAAKRPSMAVHARKCMYISKDALFAVEAAQRAQDDLKGLENDPPIAQYPPIGPVLGEFQSTASEGRRTSASTPESTPSSSHQA